VQRAEALIGAAADPGDGSRVDASGLRAAIRLAEEASAQALRDIDAAIERRRVEAETAARVRADEARRAAARQEDRVRLSEELDHACGALDVARRERHRAEADQASEHAAWTLSALRQGLRPGASCVVCGQLVTALPDATSRAPSDAGDRWRSAQERELALAVRAETLRHLLVALEREIDTDSAPAEAAPTLGGGGRRDGTRPADGGGAEKVETASDAGPRLAEERAALTARMRALEAARRELDELVGELVSDEHALLTAEREAGRCRAELAEAERALELVREQAARLERPWPGGPSPSGRRADGPPRDGDPPDRRRDEDALETLSARADGPLLPWLETVLGEWLAARHAEHARPLELARLDHARERVEAGRLALRERVAQSARARAAAEAEREAALLAARARSVAGMHAQDAERAEAALTAFTVAAERARADAEAAERERERIARLLPRRAAEHAALLAELTAACAGPLATEADGSAHVARARVLLGSGGEELDRLATELERLERERHAAHAVLEERQRQLASGADGESSEAWLLAEHARLEAARRLAAEALGEARGASARAEERRLLDDDARARHASRRAALTEHDAKLAVWRDLDDALGSADGKKLRVHAQRLTLALLVREASRHLADLAPRYALELAPSELSLHVIDRSMGGEVRTATALSGGETFVVSLALALGLAGLASRRMSLGTLFVDEGFGSLDAASLEVVLSALDALEATGRQVGIVSHVPELEERFAARVEVRPEGQGKSRVVVVG
jgi:exonuclease SbcC